MKQNSLETTDIFKGAFFLCKGGDLCSIRIKNNGKRTATFLFTGPDLHSHDKAYINGHALVNPVQFREALNQLRDIMFERIRNRKRRYSNDRERENRGAQKKH